MQWTFVLLICSNQFSTTVLKSFHIFGDLRLCQKYQNGQMSNTRLWHRIPVQTNRNSIQLKNQLDNAELACISNFILSLGNVRLLSTMPTLLHQMRSIAMHAPETESYFLGWSSQGNPDFSIYLRTPMNVSFEMLKYMN